MRCLCVCCVRCVYAVCVHAHTSHTMCVKVGDISSPFSCYHLRNGNHTRVRLGGNHCPEPSCQPTVRTSTHGWCLNFSFLLILRGTKACYEENFGTEQLFPGLLIKKSPGTYYSYDLCLFKVIHNESCQQPLPASVGLHVFQHSV